MICIKRLLLNNKFNCFLKGKNSIKSVLENQEKKNYSSSSLKKRQNDASW